MTQRVMEPASFTLDDRVPSLGYTWQKGKTDSKELSSDIHRGSHKMKIN